MLLSTIANGNACIEGADLPSTEKARFCTRCREFLPLVLFIENDCAEGTVATVCKRHNENERNNHVRWCRDCDAFIDLALFQKTNVHFLCRKHKYERAKRSLNKQTKTPLLGRSMTTSVEKRTKSPMPLLCAQASLNTHTNSPLPGVSVPKLLKKRPVCPLQALIVSQLSLCRMDCKIFKRGPTTLKTLDLRNLLRHTTLEERPLCVLVPVDPRQITTIDNVVVVTREKRKELMQCFKCGKIKAYKRNAQAEMAKMPPQDEESPDEDV